MYKIVKNNGINYQPQLVIARFSNHQQYEYHHEHDVDDDDDDDDDNDDDDDGGPT